MLRRSVVPLLASLPRAWSAYAAPRTRLLFAGDIMLSRYVGKLSRSRHDPALPLREIAPFLAAADLTFANLESPFSDHGGFVEQGMVFKAEPDMIAALELAGIDVLSTANNHSRDCGRHGVEFTLDWLRQHGIAPVGTGESAEAAHAGAILERNGLRFGFLAYTFDQSNGNYADSDSRIAVMDIPTMRRDVAALRARAGVVIVSMHAGLEYSAKPNRLQIDFARAAIDAGARVVAGHHPHVVQPSERYREGVIFYSLGNLVFDQFQRPETQRGELAEVIFDGSEIASFRTIPVTILKDGPRVT